MTAHHLLTSDVIDRLLLDSEPWLSCDDCFELVDRAVERVLMGTRPMAEAFRVHLLACPACHEEAFSLASLVGPDLGMDPGEASGRLADAVGESSS